MTSERDFIHRQAAVMILESQKSCQCSNSQTFFTNNFPQDHSLTAALLRNFTLSYSSSVKIFYLTWEHIAYIIGQACSSLSVRAGSKGWGGGSTTNITFNTPRSMNLQKCLLWNLWGWGVQLASLLQLDTLAATFAHRQQQHQKSA